MPTSTMVRWRWWSTTRYLRWAWSNGLHPNSVLSCASHSNTSNATIFQVFHAHCVILSWESMRRVCDLTQPSCGMHCHSITRKRCTLDRSSSPFETKKCIGSSTKDTIYPIWKNWDWMYRVRSWFLDWMHLMHMRPYAIRTSISKTTRLCCCYVDVWEECWPKSGSKNVQMSHFCV